MENGKFDYVNAEPIKHVIQKVQKMWEDGHSIIIFTARGMRTYRGDVQKIEEKVKPGLERWLKMHKVPYHAIVMGKPWGPNVWYVDDRCLSPDQFAGIA